MLAETMHLDEHTLDEYVLGRTTPEQRDQIDDHLFFCESCQTRVLAAEQFLRNLRAAAVPEPLSAKPERRSLWQVPSYAWAPVAAAVLIVGGVALHQSQPQVETAEAQLSATRGAADGAVPVVHSARQTRLQLDVRGLPVLAQYRVELANETGSTVWTRMTDRRGDQVDATVEGSFSSGLYWVRVYNPSNSELLREYGLQIR